MTHVTHAQSNVAVASSRSHGSDPINAMHGDNTAYLRSLASYSLIPRFPQEKEFVVVDLGPVSISRDKL
jgi:hypothetical protein